MFYDLECRCGVVSEFMMSANDIDVEFSCPECGEILTRRNNRVFNVPIIQGDTVSGGCSYDYYDDALGMHISSRHQRSEEMKKRGLVEYEQNPTIKKIRDENSYVRRNSNPGDPDAAATIRKNHKAADKYRRDTIRDSIVDKAFDGITKGQSA